MAADSANTALPHFLAEPSPSGSATDVAAVVAVCFSHSLLRVFLKYAAVFVVVPNDAVR